MPKKAMTVSYSKAGGRKMKKREDVKKDIYRKPVIIKMGKPEILSELAQFVLDNQDPDTSLPSTLDLIRQFQEEHKKHGNNVLAKTGNFGRTLSLVMCPVDGHIRMLGK